jgi:hypothetical protein
MQDKIKLSKRLEQEQNLLNGMRPTSKQYQKQYLLVKNLKNDLEFLVFQEKLKEG